MQFILEYDFKCETNVLLHFAMKVQNFIPHTALLHLGDNNNIKRARTRSNNANQCVCK